MTSARRMLFFLGALIISIIAVSGQQRNPAAKPRVVITAGPELDDNNTLTYRGDITFSDPSSLATTFRVPSEAEPGQTIHIIFEATDNGAPPLTRYQRVVVRVQ